jgi:outer membrane protein assembly factor BamA
MSHFIPKWLGVCALPGMLTLNTPAAAQPKLFPPEAIYPTYLADPLRPTFNAQIQSYTHSTIANTGTNRFDLKLGANLLSYETGVLNQPWQLVLLGGFHGQFDNEYSQDNIGWDGIYGFHIATRQNQHLAWRVGIKHTSAHIGDELIERIGRSRIGYTREELRAGVAWSPHVSTTLYSETGYAYDLRNEALQQPWRVQLGAQYQSPGKYWRDQISWYSAVDLSAYEENNWDINTTIQIGFGARSGSHEWHLGLEFYDGRSQLGEFFQDNERYMSLGLWFDL